MAFAEPEGRTQVGIVGAGPAGLLLAHLLHQQGIDSVVLERHSRGYVEERVRAGVLEQNTVDLLIEADVGERMRQEGLVHHGIEIRFDGEGHRIALTELSGGRSITVYGQQKVVRDLIDARQGYGGPLHFEAEVTELGDLDGEQPWLRYSLDGNMHTLRCDFIAGCDGFHGVSRPAIPADRVQVFERAYPHGWVGILAEVAPSTEELIYAYHDRGFALHSLRSPTLSRLYVQCDADDELDNWPDERVWEELHARLARNDGWTLKEGPVVEKTLARMHAFVIEPMQYGRLFLAGDAAHIVPPTGAKGLNLAVADIRHLSRALIAHYKQGRDGLLEGYSKACLPRIWRAQQFTSWMTRMLHPDRSDDAFRKRLQRAELEYLARSERARMTLAENYVGMPEL
ncbi:MAG TPA: 4-hydroxybenzoate 3-monooxygenase [Gammaproteobacteria bacterium]|nr:4-hydroxybenzoate 3-monooxygenase [Gammaproteobacteria bacterium]